MKSGSRHLDEVRSRRLAEIDKVEREVKARLTAEITYWHHRANELELQESAGRDTRLSSDNARARARTLEERLQRRLAELALERDIHPGSPVVCAAALVVPATLVSGCDGDAADAGARREVERLAMEAVLAHERRLGFAPVDVSALNLGWDVESRGPDGGLRLIEVKGRRSGADTVTLTTNELLAALNAPDRWLLAIVEVAGDGAAAPPRYVRGFPFREPMPGEAAVVLKLAELLARAEERDQVRAKRTCPPRDQGGRS